MTMAWKRREDMKSSVSVLGWPQKMTKIEDTVTRTSLRYDPTGKTLAQIANPLAASPELFTKTVPPAKMVANVLIQEMSPGGRKFGFYLWGNNEIWEWTEFKKYGYNIESPPKDVVDRAIGLVQDWLGEGLDLAQSHIREENQPHLVSQLALYIRSIGRTHEESNGRVLTKIDRSAHGPEPERGPDPAAPETDVQPVSNNTELQTSGEARDTGGPGSCKGANEW